jgi:hypothetical protein
MSDQAPSNNPAVLPDAPEEDLLDKDSVEQEVENQTIRERLKALTGRVSSATLSLVGVGRKQNHWLDSDSLPKRLRVSKRWRTTTKVALFASQIGVLSAIATEAGDDFTTDPFDYARNAGEFWKDPIGNLDEARSIYADYLGDPENLWIPGVTQNYNDSIDTLEYVWDGLGEVLTREKYTGDLSEIMLNAFLESTPENDVSANVASDMFLEALPGNNDTYAYIVNGNVSVQVPIGELDVRALYRITESQIDDYFESNSHDETLRIEAASSSGLLISSHGDVFIPFRIAYWPIGSWYIMASPDDKGNYAFNVLYHRDEKYFRMDVDVVTNLVDTESLSHYISDNMRLRSEYLNYRDTGESTESLDTYFRNRIMNGITGSDQRVRREHSYAAEDFITPEMADQVTNSLLMLANTLNIDLLSLCRVLETRVLNMPIYYNPTNHERGHIRYTDHISVDGDSDERIKHVLVHEYIHGILEGAFPHNNVPSYREGLTELLAIVATSGYDDPIYDAYSESTLLLASSGMWQDIMNAGRSSEAPLTVAQSFGAVPSLADVTARNGDINDDDIQNIWRHPQTDHYVLWRSWRQEHNSVRLLRSYVRESGSWTQYRRNLAEMIASTLDNAPEAQTRVKNKLRRLWN